MKEPVESNAPLKCEGQVTLHLLNKPPSHPRFHSCMAALQAEDHLLLMENAVIALADSSVALPPDTSALVRDCLARGLAEGVRDGVTLVDTRGMVELTDRFQRIISW
ncbi:sulfurtransferase complex subunit TusB [Marinobacter sp.]|uniref:sulfurtransferase complex subunit TusB n=1 Tax=Marinobacter sp. TaxID=50741 RepID=UPI00356B5897